MKNTLISIIILNTVLGVAAGSTSAQHDGHDHGEPAGAAHVMPAAAYPLDIDPVTGEKLGAREGLVSIEHEGRELLFSSNVSAKTFETDPEKYLARVDKAIIRTQLPFYALETCVISGESLEESGDEVIDFVYGNRLVRVCCKPCGPKFLAAPGKFLPKIDAAIIAAQTASYPLDECLVSGEALGAMGDPIDHVVGSRLVRLCCKGCIKKVDANPAKYLGKLNALTGKQSMDAAGHDEHGEHGGHDEKDEHGGHDDHEGHGR